MLLFRNLGEVEEELFIANEVFGNRLVEHRTDVPPSSVVVGRYSVLPFYKELEEELNEKNSYLVNSYEEHSYIANMDLPSIDRESCV